MATSRYHPKVVVTGPKGSGKTAILKRKFDVHNIHPEKYIPTAKSPTWEEILVDDQPPYLIEIHDIAGSETQQSFFREAGMRGADVCFLVIGADEEWDNPQEKANDLLKFLDGMSESTSIYLVVNKIDLLKSSDSGVRIQHLQLILTEKLKRNIPLFFCSAKNSERYQGFEEQGIHGLFDRAARDFLKKQQIKSLILELEQYWNERDTTRGGALEYLSFWGRFFGYSKTEKLHAVDALLNELQGNANEGLTKTDINALHQGELGKIIKKYEKMNIGLKEIINRMHEKSKPVSFQI